MPELFEDTWRIYQGDTGILTIKDGRKIIIKWSDDKTHVTVQFVKPD